jgi:hypothetical protein
MPKTEVYMSALSCMSYRAARVIALVALTVGLAAPATAAPVTWEWLGSVRTSTIPGIAVGDDASLRITFESTVPDLDSSPTCGLYSPILSAAGTFGGQVYTFDHGTFPPGGAVEVLQGNAVGCGGTAIHTPSLTFRVFGSTFVDMIAFFENGLALPSDALPTVPPSPFNYANAGFRLDLSLFGPDRSVVADTQAVRVVPEPATAWLLGVSLAVVARRRLTARRKANEEV